MHKTEFEPLCTHSQATLVRRPLFQSYENRIAVVSGAASGIGRAAAALFAELGMRVQALDVRPCSPADFGSLAERVSTFEIDISNRVACCELAEEISRAGKIATLVNAAGIVLPDSSDGPSATMEKLFRVNVLGTAHLCEAFLPHFEAEGSTIVNISSILASMGWPGRSAYVASKGGVDALTRSLALEYAARGIRVNAIAPGLVATPMIREIVMRSSDPYQEYLARASFQASKKLLAPEEVATSILYLATDLSRGVRGATIDLSDGRLAGYLPQAETRQAEENSDWLAFKAG